MRPAVGPASSAVCCPLSLPRKLTKPKDQVERKDLIWVWFVPLLRAKHANYQDNYIH